MRFTPRQAQILPLIAEGLTDQEIGDRLFLERSTVKNHVGRILGVVGARNRAHLVHLAHLQGLLGDQPPATPTVQEGQPR